MQFSFAVALQGADIGINLLSVVNVKPFTASVALIGLYNEGREACRHEGSARKEEQMRKALECWILLLCIHFTTTLV